MISTLLQKSDLIFHSKLWRSVKSNPKSVIRLASGFDRAEFSAIFSTQIGSKSSPQTSRNLFFVNVSKSFCLFLLLTPKNVSKRDSNSVRWNRSQGYWPSNHPKINYNRNSAEGKFFTLSSAHLSHKIFFQVLVSGRHPEVRQLLHVQLNGQRCQRLRRTSLSFFDWKRLWEVSVRP